MGHFRLFILRSSSLGISQISLPSRRAGSPDHIIGQFANFCSSLEVWFENVAVKMKTLEVKRAKFGMEKDLVE